jgi:enterochelin esterase-like enzyme
VSVSTRWCTAIAFAALATGVAPAGVRAARLHAQAGAAGGVATTPNGSVARGPDGLVRLRVTSAALAGNLLGDSPERTLLVWVPPDYDSTTTRYRTLYLLHGYGAQSAGNTSWLRSYGGFHLGRTLDELHARGEVRDLIVIAVDGGNSLGGSFYRNSPVSGNWGTYVREEVVRLVDRTLRTIPAAHARGIAGHSMGGYGALVHATLHPEIFGAVYAMSPCCMTFDDRPAANAQTARLYASANDRASIRRAGFFAALPLALGTVYSPNPSRTPLFVDLPFVVRDGEVRGDSAVIARWHGGTPLRLMDSLSGNLAKLRGIGFDAGREDPYRDIPRTIPVLDSLLSARGVAHHAELYTGDHSNRIPDRLVGKVLPFMQDVLARTP